jgi:hypothetical protein
MTKELCFKAEKAPLLSLRQLVFGTSCFATEIPERDHSISFSFCDIDDPGRAGALLERELLLRLVMNGVR